MNHISLQSLLLNLKNKKIDKVRKHKDKNIEYKQYAGWKFWDNCSSYFN